VLQEVYVEQIKFYRSPIDRAVLRELTERRNLRPLIHVLAQLALVAATGIGCYLIWLYLPWPLLIPAIFIHGTFYTFLGPAGAGHELSHRTVFKSKVLNEIFLALTAFLTYFFYHYFRPDHTRHHQVTVYKGLDTQLMLPIDYKDSFWPWLLTLDLPRMRQYFRVLVKQALAIFKSDWEKTLLDNNKKLRRQVVWWARFVLVAHIGLVVFFILSGNWILILLVTLAPFIGNWLNYLAELPQHAGLKGDVPDWRVSARTMTLGPFVEFLYWSMNYHVEHHMFAAVPFYNLRKLRNAIEADLPTCTHGLAATWKEMWPVLRRIQKEPEYVFIPNFPDSAHPPVMGEAELGATPS